MEMELKNWRNQNDYFYRFAIEYENYTRKSLNSYLVQSNTQIIDPIHIISQRLLL